MSDAEDATDDEPRDLDAPRAQDPRDLPIRFSALKMRARSGKHYRHAALYRSESTTAQRMGTATHAATFGTPPLRVFGPGAFEGKEYRGAKSGKYWTWFQEQPENVGAVIVNEKEARKAHAMAEVLRNDPHAAPLLFAPTAVYEHEIEWTIPWINGTRRKCAGRIDVLDAYGLTLADLKALRDASPEKFLYTGRRDGYHAQAVWYADGCAAAGIGQVAPYIVVIENVAPYVPVTHRLSPRAIEDGRAMYRGWLEKLRSDEENNRWGGYSDSVYDFDVPEEMPLLHGFDDDDGEQTYAA